MGFARVLILKRLHSAYVSLFFFLSTCLYFSIPRNFDFTFNPFGAVKLMRTRIRLLAQPESMHSIIDATQREQRHGSAGNWCVNGDGSPAGPHSHQNPTLSPCCAFSGQEWQRGVVWQLSL